MGDTVTKEALEWALGCTDAVKASAVVTRLMNDLASFKVQINLQDYHPYTFYLLITHLMKHICFHSVERTKMMWPVQWSVTLVSMV
jgi:hypothetical protein